MGRELWNSQAAVIRSGEDVPSVVVAVGSVHEMIEVMLSQEPEHRDKLSLVGEAIEQPIDTAQAQQLQERRDYPIVC